MLAESKEQEQPIVLLQGWNVGIPGQDHWWLPALAEHGKWDLCFLPQSFTASDGIYNTLEPETPISLCLSPDSAEVQIPD